jgi:hypothetical protein
MYKTISNKIIRTIKPSYNPSKYITDENEELPIKDWIQKYRILIPTDDIMRLLCRKEFLSEKDLRLFAVWCAREALKLVEKIDKQSVKACDVAEQYANGQATKEELNTARNNARNAAYNANYYAIFDVSAAPNYYATKAAYYATKAAYYADAAYKAASHAADVAYFNVIADRKTISNAQIDKLLTYFE